MVFATSIRARACHTRTLPKDGENERKSLLASLWNVSMVDEDLCVKNTDQKQ